MKNAIRPCIACLLVLAGGQALAMYRCGNVFQDKPCDSGTQINLSPGGRPQASPAAPSAAPVARPSAPPANAASFAIVCSRIGEQAQRITWRREGGATLEQQLAERATVLSPDEQAKTVRSVYARRGSAPDIRSQVEAECMADKDKEAQAAALLDQLRKQAGETAGQPAAVGAPAAAPAVKSAEATAAPAASNKPSASHCRNLKKSVEDARSRLAQGGSARQMESLQGERRSADQSLRESGC